MKLAMLALAFLPVLLGQQPRVVKHTGDCISAPCYSSINIPFDGEGQPAPSDAGPGYWGRQGAALVSISFDGVPPGYGVQILHIRGDLVAWAHGPVGAGRNAGVLWSAQTTQSLGSDSPTHLEYGTDGCFAYVQGSVNATNLRAPFDIDLSAQVVVLTDGLLWSKEAVWLNDTGQSIHEEWTAVLTYRFLKL